MKNKIKINWEKWLPILIWGFLFAFVFNLNYYNQPLSNSFIRATYEIFNLCVIYYATTLYLFPKYYKNNKEYFHISITVVLAFSVLFFLLDIYVIPDFSNPGTRRPPIFFHFFFRYLMSFIFTYFVATSISLMENNNKLKEREKLLTEEKLATELKLLKAQINPHFIFNALNNIYSLTYMQKKNAPGSVLKLSEMLRYVFYDCSKDRMPISSELKYIDNFIAFQQMKSEFAQNIKVETTLRRTNIEIAPMLFVPFIENAFKYSRVEEDEQAKVNISIRDEGEKLLFSIINSVPENRRSPGSGMGIENVKHRLDIIYPKRYVLAIDQGKELFKVDLTLEI